MTDEIRFLGAASGQTWRRSLTVLLLALTLWALALGQLLVSVPRSLAVAQNFNLHLPWYMEAIKNLPLWAVVAAAVLACLLGLRSRGWRRVLLLVGVPAAAAIALHLSVYGAQSKLLWGLSH